jgi:hypothetical protein
MSQFDVAYRRRKRMIVIIAGSVLVAMIAAVSVAATQSLSRTGAGKKNAAGVVSLVDRTLYLSDNGSNTAATGGCHGVGAYSDLVGGGAVSILDSAGKQIASTQLQPGTIDANGYCEFPFQVKVTTGHGPYGVQITRRSVTPVTEAALFSLVTLTLPR